MSTIAHLRAIGGDLYGGLREIQRLQDRITFLEGLVKASYLEGRLDEAGYDSPRMQRLAEEAWEYSRVKYEMEENQT